MLIDGTSDKIQFKLGGSITTNQLVFTVDYVNYTSTSATLTSNNGVSNNITTVDLVPSPSASQQNELRYCSIYNADTVAQTVKILVYNGTTTYQIFQAVLAPNNVMQYQLEKGWEVIDSLGNKKNYGIQCFNNNIRSSNKNYRLVSNAGTFALTANVLSFASLGRADKAYTSITLTYIVTTAGVGLTLAEMGIYSGKFMGTDLGSVVGKRVGYVDTSAVWNSLGTKTTTISLSGVVPGDMLRVALFAAAPTTYPQFRTFNLVNDLLDQSLFGTYAGSNLSAKISGTTSFIFNQTGTPVNSFLIRWQAT